MNVKQKIGFPLVLLLGVLGLIPAVQAMDEMEEEDEFALSFEDKLGACAGCHGEDGKTPLAPEYPRLAGQHQSYLEYALKAYASGRRNNMIMASQIQALEIDDNDIRKLAAHFAAMPGLRPLNIIAE